MHSPFLLLLAQFYSKSNTSIPSSIPSSDLRTFINESIRYINPEDAKYLYDDLTKQKTSLTQEQAFQIYYNFENEAAKIFNRVQPELGYFIFESFVRIQKSQYKDQPSFLILDKSDYLDQKRVDITRSFSDILSEDYLKKLINMGANGLINQKQEEKVQKYFYNHWVESNEPNFLIMDTERLEVQLLKNIWTFQFQKSLKIAELIHQKVQNEVVQDLSLLQITSIIPGLQNLHLISTILQKNSIIKQLIQNRITLNIEFNEDLLRKNNPNISFKSQQILQLKQEFNDVMQLWTFTQEYFDMIEDQISNAYFRQVVVFINSNQNDKQRSEEQICQFAQLQSIGIIERFLYAKKYFTQNSFELFKQIIKSNLYSLKHLDYILLFGNKKQSQVILQNYLDQTSHIQKVALISVYLKTFSEQVRMVTSHRSPEPKSFYARFINVYQWLLDKVDGGISRHLFDKKCLSIEIERKRKNLTKTFTFNCINCKAPQIYSFLSKRINIDPRQPKPKGYHYFAKDNRVQIMYCIECMIMLPKCSICLYPISVYNAYAEQMKKNATQKKVTNKGQTFDKALVWCPKCKHGGHFSHIMDWFSEDKRKCPVSNCMCKCLI